MQKPRMLMTILLLSVILSFFAGCQSQNADAPTEPTGTAVSSQPTEATEDQTLETTEATEPSSDATEPIETTYPRTIEAFKTHLKPYMTFSETRTMFGRRDDWEGNNIFEKLVAIWFLEDDYFVMVSFYSPVRETWGEYLEKLEADSVLSEEEFQHHFAAWFNRMEAYKATLYKGSPIGKREQIEDWFDCGYGPFWQEEETP